MGSRLFSKREIIRHNARIGRGRAKRLKTFASEEKAKEWAKKNNISSYIVEIVNSANPDKAKYRVKNSQ